MNWNQHRKLFRVLFSFFGKAYGLTAYIVVQCLSIVSLVVYLLTPFNAVFLVKRDNETKVTQRQHCVFLHIDSPEQYQSQLIELHENLIPQSHRFYISLQQYEEVLRKNEEIIYFDQCPRSYFIKTVVVASNSSFSLKVQIDLMMPTKDADYDPQVFLRDASF